MGVRTGCRPQDVKDESGEGASPRPSTQSPITRPKVPEAIPPTPPRDRPSRYIHRVDPLRACDVTPALQSTPTKPSSLSLLCRRRSPSLVFSRSLSRVFSPLVLALAHALFRERVLFIGTQFSILYTSMYSPAEAATHSLSHFSHARLPLARVLSFSLSLSLLAILSTSKDSRGVLRAFWDLKAENGVFFSDRSLSRLNFLFSLELLSNDIF